MWPADTATGLHHEAGENEGLLSEFETVVGDDVVVNDAECHYVKSRNEGVYEAGGNESNTAQRKVQPGYLRFETRSSEELDWRDSTTSIVSPWSLILYNNVPFPLLCSLHAGSQSAPICTIVCLQFSLCQSFICCLKALS